MPMTGMANTKPSKDVTISNIRLIKLSVRDIAFTQDVQ